MARPLSPEKRQTILDAAMEVVASAGTGATTAAIAKVAGFAEGTLFTYFPTKDDLLNALYLDIKSDLHAHMTRYYKPSETLEERCRSVWECFIAWGAADSRKNKALRQLSVSDRVTDDTRRQALCVTSPLSQVLTECAECSALKGLAKGYPGTLMSAMAEITFDYIAAEPAKAKRHTRTGFESFWRAIGCAD